MSSPPNGTTTIVFTFLISFLGVFGAIIFGGIIWHRTISTRNSWETGRTLGHTSRQYPHSIQKPLIRDIWVEKPTVNHSTFDDLLPLCLQKCTLPHKHSRPDTPTVPPPVTDSNQFGESLTGTQPGSSWRLLHQFDGINDSQRSRPIPPPAPKYELNEQFQMSVIIALPSSQTMISPQHNMMPGGYMLGTIGLSVPQVNDGSK